jgi:hypothetical protein
MNNHTLYSADRATHLKIVVVAMICAVTVAVIGSMAQTSSIDLGTAPLVKAGQPSAFAHDQATIVR